MRPPSKKEVQGYDIVVWIDSDGDVVTRAFTPVGHTTLRKFVNQYTPGDIVQIYSDPKEFTSQIPSTVVVGMLSRKGVKPMQDSALH